MIKQLKKVGDGNAIFLDKTLLELVGLEEGGEVQVTVHEGAIVITPAHPKPVPREQFEAALENVVANRGKVLRRLAK